MLLVSYDGSAYHGFAAQEDPELPTVGGVLSATLGQMVGEAVSLTCAGRTDAGVHATGQVVHADLPSGRVGRFAARGPGAISGELPRLATALSHQLGPSLAVLRAAVAPAGFDARHSAVARRYRYDLLRTPWPDPLERHTSWHVPGELDLGAMRIAADALLGEHDFTAFCRRPPDHEGPLFRRVLDAGWQARRDGRRLSFEVEANAFCHHMVRAVVAFLVAVGKGRLTAAELLASLRAGSRHHGGGLAPPEGLRLVSVRYPDHLVPGGVFSAGPLPAAP